MISIYAVTIAIGLAVLTYVAKDYRATKNQQIEKEVDVFIKYKNNIIKRNKKWSLSFLLLSILNLLVIIGLSVYEYFSKTGEESVFIPIVLCLFFAVILFFVDIIIIDNKIIEDFDKHIMKYKKNKNLKKLLNLYNQIKDPDFKIDVEEYILRVIKKLKRGKL